MDEATFQQIPETVILRELRFQIVEPGRRAQSVDVITTLVDGEEYTREDIAELYGIRWNSELDLRSTTSNLQLGHVRCMTSSRVRSVSPASASTCWHPGCKCRLEG